MKKSLLLLAVLAAACASSAIADPAPASAPQRAPLAVLLTSFPPVVVLQAPGDIPPPRTPVPLRV